MNQDPRSHPSANPPRRLPTGEDLREANLVGAELAGEQLEGAELGGAWLSGADLSGANLHGAHLENTELTGADLRGADLHAADLRGAEFGGADLRGADLRGAYLEGSHLTGARYDRYTRWPRRFSTQGLVWIGQARRRAQGSAWVEVLAFWGVGLALATLDQTSKAWALETLVHLPQPPSLGVLHLRIVTNPGMLFGFGAAVMPATVGLETLLLAGIAAHWLMRLLHKKPLPRLISMSLGLVAGGGLGNVLDRMRYGSVVDFIEIDRWLTFNVADLAIAVGLLCLLSTGAGRPATSSADT